MGVVIRRQLEGQKNRPGVTAAPGYCMAICFYYAALGHMFLLVGCGRGAGPYVSIMRRWAVCFYCLAVGVALGHMFLLCVCMYVYMCVCICVCMYVCMYVYVCV